MASSARFALSRLRPLSTVLFICDVQQKFAPLIYNFPTIVNRINLLRGVSDLLEVPYLVTEQYPKALGHTVPELQIPATTPVFAKKTFSMLTEEFTTSFKALNRNQVLLVGLEGHVCVLQTALDLLESGAEVHVVCDAISSQRPHDRAVALQRMRDAGAVLTTAESAIFDLTGTADHPNFKAISGLVKASNEGVHDFAQSSAI